MDTWVNALSSLAKSESSMIVLLIVVGIVTIIVGVPLYRLRLSSEEARLKQWSEREDKILAVIQQNSESHLKVAEAVVGVKTLIETNQRQCASCMKEQMDRFESLKEDHEQLQLGMSRLTIILEERCDVHGKTVVAQGSNERVGNTTGAA